MKAILLVALGGSLGAVSRFELARWVTDLSPDWKFPIGTFVVNVMGCFVAGVLAGLAEKHNLFSEDARMLLFVGLLGGFTTFSAFGLETVMLLRRNETGIAVSYVVLSLLCGLAVLWLGTKLGTVGRGE